MIPKQVLDLADATYKAKLNDEHAAFITQINTLQAQFAARNIVGGHGVAAIYNLVGQTMRQRCRLAAEELQHACVSKGIVGNARLATDLREAWISMTLKRGFPDVHLWTMRTLQPHVGDAELNERNWQAAIGAAATRGSAEANSILDHYAMERQRDKSRAIRNALFAIGGWIAGVASAVLGAYLSGRITAH
jgi:hypothetical protein